jgi:uncharacterized RDD family membrane protein YckC
MSDPTTSPTDHIAPENEPNEEKKEFDLPVSDLIVRIKASFADVIVIIFIMIAGTYIFESMGNVSDDARMWLLIFVFAIYEPLFVSLGCTVGQFMMKTRVRSFSNPDKRILPHWAIVRYVIKMALGVISFFTISSTVGKRALHDLAIDSVVIDVSKYKSPR